MTVVYDTNAYTLTVNYKYPDGSEAATAHTESVKYTVDYSVESPVITGYTANQLTVSGTMPAENVTVTVVYDTNAYTLTVNYQYPDGSEAATTHTESVKYTVGYSVESPVITGYTADQLTVSGTMPAEDVTVTVVYDTNAYTLTVNYKYPDGTEAASVKYTVAYSVTSPSIANYVADTTTVTGTMGTNNVVKNVTYYLVETNIVDATNCSGTGNGSITVTAPTGNYEYSLNGTDFQTETSFSNLSEGNYNLYIRPVNDEYNYVGEWTIALVINMPVAEVSSNDSIICPNAPIQLSGEGSSTGSNYSYAWTGPADFSSSDMTPAAFDASNGNMTGTYTLTVTDNASNCVSSKSLNIYVNSPTNPDYEFTIRGFNAVGNIELGHASTTPNILNPIVTHYMDEIVDDYSSTVTLVNDAPAEFTATGEYTVIWTATDACGNTATCSIVVTITEVECTAVQDVDGNIYQSVKVGTNCWMAENLRTTHYADGRSITNVYQYQSNDYPNDAENVNTYGLLYDWYDALDVERPTRSVHVQGICPDGWYVPTDEEFAELYSMDLASLRSTNYWFINPGTNESGYDLRPGGYYNVSLHRYENIRINAYLWSASSTGTTEAHCHMADCNCYMIIDMVSTKNNGYSVRCVKE